MVKVGMRQQNGINFLAAADQIGMKRLRKDRIDILSKFKGQRKAEITKDRSG